jgi:hypothetical protein
MFKMKHAKILNGIIGLAFLALALFQVRCAPKPAVRVTPRQPFIFAVHVLVESTDEALGLIAGIPAMAKAGVNLLVCEIDYNYEFVSHPELRRADPVTRDMVKEMVRLCRRHKIRLVPEFQTLGHQSWAENTWPLLTKYPQFDETPGKYPGNKDGDKEFYCRSWCPLHPDLNPIVFSLYDELLDVFEADALHVGMDEVFLIGDKDCPRCAGKDPAELFAHAVNTAYDHLVKEKGVEMFIWADRFLDGEATGYGEWEASMNKTYPAVDMVPKDIIMCDWHYERKYENMKGTGFPSVSFFLEKGFRVLPASFKDTKAVKMLIDDSFKYPSERMLGHMCTIWGGVEPDKIAKCDQFKTIAKELRKYGLLTEK